MKNRLVIFDGNCKVCATLAALMKRIGILQHQELQPYQALQPELKVRVAPERFRNEMALIDTSGGKSLYGAEAISFIFSHKLPLLAPVFGFKPFFKLFIFLYKTLAFNRYIIATPTRNMIACDCFPEAVSLYRWTYIFICSAIAILLTTLFGISLKDIFAISEGDAAMQMLLMAGTGWVIQISFAFLLLPESIRLAYIGHLGSIMVAGLLVLLPTILLYFLTGITFIPLPIISVIISSSLMLYLHYHRVKHLGLPQTWTASWFLLLQVSANLWIYYFYL